MDWLMLILSGMVHGIIPVGCTFFCICLLKRRGRGFIIRVILYSSHYGMQYVVHQCSAYLLVRLHPNVGVPGTTVHWRSLLPDEVCHLNTPSRIPVQITHTHHCISSIWIWMDDTQWNVTFILFRLFVCQPCYMSFTSFPSLSQPDSF